MSEGKTPPTSQAEELLVLVQHRAKPLGSTEMKRFLPGQTYKQSGLDKLEVIGSGKATRDLNAKLPVSTKRKAPKDGPKKDPVTALSEKIDKLIDLLMEKKK